MTDKLEQLANLHAEKYETNRISAYNSFIAGYKARDEEIEELKDRVDCLRGELRGLKSKESK